MEDALQRFHVQRSTNLLCVLEDAKGIRKSRHRATGGKVHHLLAKAYSFEQEVCLNTKAKENTMSPFILLVFVLVVGACVYGYMTYRANAQRQAREKKRNQYHDRV